MPKLRIKQRVLLLTIFPTIVISLFMGTYFISVRIKELNQNINNRGSAIVSRLASLGQNGAFTGDFDTLREIARKKISEETSTVVFYNQNGNEIASAGKLSAAIDPKTLTADHKIIIVDYKNSIGFITSISIPDIIIGDSSRIDKSAENNLERSSVIGWVKIELELKETRAQMYKILIDVGLIVLLGLTISGLIAFRMGSDVTIPILALTNAVARIKQGKLDTRVTVNAKWELEVLKSGINTMAQALENATQEMQAKIVMATSDLRQTLETIEIQNEELDLARKNAENISKAKSEFLASMSHELRTPLNGMLGFIDILQKTELSKNQQEYIKIVEKSSENLLSIIDDILDFSKMEAGKLQISYEPMDFYECIEDAIVLLAPNAHKKSLELTPFIYSDVPQRIIGDSGRIKQVITNLVSNAIKFTEKGGIAIRVMVKEENKYYVTLGISVTDTGIGLNEQQKKFIFNAFSQAAPDTAKKFGGTGLGLAISKILVERMQGTIDVESSLNQGSTFWFTFKAKKIYNPIMHSADYFISGKKAVLFEKYEVTKLAIMHMLKFWGVSTVPLENLEEHGMQAIQETRPDVIIISLYEDETNLKKIIDIIRHAKNSRVKVVILANSVYQTIHQNILDLNVDLYVTKPILRKKFYNSLCELFIEQIILKNDQPKNITSQINNDEKVNYTTNGNNKNLNSIFENTNIENSTNNSNYKFNNINVLAVDDHEINLKLLKTMLERVGINVTIAYSGETALKIVKTTKFDIILMDINMPGMDGIATSKLLKQANTINKDTPIIALSAYISKNIIKEAEGTGICYYLMKPTSEKQLIETIIKFLKNDPNISKSFQEDKSSYDSASLEHSSGIQNEKNKLFNNNLSNMQHASAINWNLSLKLAAGNKTLAKDLLLMLISSLKDEQDTINDHFKNQDYTSLRDVVHRLYGASCYCGVPRLTVILQQLEHELHEFTERNISINKDIINFYIYKFNTEVNLILNTNVTQTHVIP